jgi:hypothetical protein
MAAFAKTTSMSPKGPSEPSRMLFKAQTLDQTKFPPLGGNTRNPGLGIETSQ